MILETYDLHKILKLCGKNLTSLSSSLSSFVKISHLVTNIQELQLFDNCISSNSRCFLRTDNLLTTRSVFVGTTSRCTFHDWRMSFLSLLNNCKNLTKFQMKMSHNFYTEEEYIQLIKRMKKLKTFHLSGCDFINTNGIIFHYLPFEMIEEIALDAWVLPFSNKLMSRVSIIFFVICYLIKTLLLPEEFRKFF